MVETAPASPCMNVCVLDADRCCTGCGRTVDEIARWGRMSASEQWAVIARLDRSRALKAHMMPAANVAVAR